LEIGPLSAIRTLIKTSTAVTMGLALVATNATVAVKAQQTPATTPATGAAAPAVAYAPRPVAAVPVQPVQYQQQQAAQPAAPAGDPYGFTAWLNGVRASYGLGAVGYDPNLAAWANANNAQQQARGIGHFVMGPARRQNSAMGHYASIGAMWMASPAHQAALLDPTIRWIGIAGMGAYWTFNAY
jgi:hypothetical protein